MLDLGRITFVVPTTVSAALLGFDPGARVLAANDQARFS
jgi:hypothetical protein